MSKQLRVAVLGATGYAGSELIRLLLGHPKVELTLLGARDRTGQPVTNSLPALTGLTELEFQDLDSTAIARQAEVAFAALPHGASAGLVAELLAKGLRVLDLSADYRLREVETYRTWYGDHPHPELLAEAAYGLPELHRESIRSARLVAVPGCYPTGAILALAPLLEAHLIEPHGIVIDSKSGVSGAGRASATSTHYPETAEGLRPYKVAGTHRHTPEIEQELSRFGGTPLRLTFTPHLVPMSRGILTTAYGIAVRPVTGELVAEVAAQKYAGSTSVAVLGSDRLPDTLWVRGSNRAHLAYRVDERTSRVLAFAAIDNLVKGAAGQAVQCLNCMEGWEEDLGIRGAAVFP